uniref:Odorant receptor n=1 Tax=Dendrolimus kikuchii TaxID=765133 RepID=A0A076EDG7_9NEOP|nr:odorant receptor [Dendrolimus kikuchii]
MRKLIYNTFHFTTFLFVITEFVDIYLSRHDLNKVLNNMSLSVLSIICLAKCYSCVFWQKEWRKLTYEISKQELIQMKKIDPTVEKLMKKYTKYTRIITYMYWILVFITNLLLILSPFLRYMSSESYRDDIDKGNEPIPQIMYSWFPFDNEKMPGYIGAVILHIVMGSQGSGVIAAYDMNAVAIMSYLKGQMTILREKCEAIFEGGETEVVLDRIKECHRHHNVLIKHYKMFSALLSPTMFLYVLICSITICCGVVQFSSKEATTWHKLWVIQYTLGLISQLFLYCWHSNEVVVESYVLDRGIYDSEWWKADARIRRQVLLLAGKMALPFILYAGPYTTLSVPTFIDILKGSYSFYTLFSHMQDDN